MSTPPIQLVPLARIDPATVESLLDRAFGQDRFGRTAYKVRGAARAIPALSVAAVEHGRLLGSIQSWPVLFAADDGSRHPLVMIGPIAVVPERQRDGIGRRLVHAVLDAAVREGVAERLMLIGDPDYYARFFGFTAAATAGWRLPGPVERHRLLAKGRDVPMLSGMLGPAG